MNKIITHIVFIWLLFAPMLTLAQTKRALVIGIGRQEDSAWNKINGDKDVPYVLKILNDANYEQIITCVNEEATKKAPTVICFEEKLPKDANLEDIIPYAVVTLFHARQQFYEQLKKA